MSKVCGNSKCAAPYFFAPRSNTRYCSSDCFEIMQRNAKKDWWDEKGPDWREKRREEARRGKELKARKKKLKHRKKGG